MEKTATNEIISAREAAARLGRGVATVEQGLRDGTFPVGTAYRTASKRWVYIIPRLAFERFLAGEIAGRAKDNITVFRGEAV